MQRTLSIPEHVDMEKLHSDLRKVYQVSSYLDFPFTANEVADYFLPAMNISGSQLQQLLTLKRFADIPFQASGGYLLTHHGQSLLERVERERMSSAKLNSAKNFAAILSKGIPFIETIAVTGSVAYGSAEKWDDIDLFIVTKRKRLWISALMMLVYVRLTKLFRLRPAHLSQFCLSYVHDELGIAGEESRNMYSPLFGEKYSKPNQSPERTITEDYFCNTLGSRESIQHHTMRNCQNSRKTASMECPTGKEATQDLRSFWTGQRDLHSRS